MRVIVTCSRDFGDLELIRRTLVQVPPGTVLVEGGAARARCAERDDLLGLVDMPVGPA